MIVTLSKKNGSVINANQPTPIAIKNDYSGAVQLYGYGFVFDESVPRIGLTSVSIKVDELKLEITDADTPLAALGIAAMPTAPGLRLCIPLGDRRNPKTLPVISKSGQITCTLVPLVNVPAGSIVPVFFGRLI